MSFYNKLEKARPSLDAYAKELKNLFEQLLAHGHDWKNPVLAPYDVLDSNPLFIIVATTKGWCGSLNANLFRYLEEAIFLEAHQRPSFILIGAKAIAYFKTSGLLAKYSNTRLVATYGELSSPNLFALADELIERTLFGPQVYSSVSFFSSEARSFFVQRPTKTTVLPFGVEMPRPGNSANQQAPLLWEQSKQDTLDFVARGYLRGLLIQLLFHAMRAEYAARFLAMESATKNAEKIIDRLTRQFNKMRQALITKEISELSAGAAQR